MKAYLLVNFGGPRDLEEIAPFLTELLRDRDVVRTRLPRFAHDWLFGRAARKRAVKIAADYQYIGGKSPIYFDTEALAATLREKLGAAVWTFHRYLPATHAASLRNIERETAQEIVVLPLFPQFCYATTGSIARFFANRLEASAVRKLRWIKSYAAHPAFIGAYQKKIAQFLRQHNLAEKETALLFSAHGVPRSFIEEGDLYASECALSFQAVLKGFPLALGYLSYQSKFGPGEWLRPYTDEACKQALSWCGGRKNVVFVPISFTSDHIETLFEIERQYLPLIAANGLTPYRCPALNQETYWVDALLEILRETNTSANRMLVRG